MLEIGEALAGSQPRLGTSKKHGEAHSRMTRVKSSRETRLDADSLVLPGIISIISYGIFHLHRYARSDTFNHSVHHHIEPALIKYMDFRKNIL